LRREEVTHADVKVTVKMPGWRSSRERSPPVCRQERSGRLRIAALSI
jgi:hypothetical protein